MNLLAVIFDLDGVIVSTDEYHYQGWQRLADEEGIYFDRTINQRLRGVSRMESLAILLERAPHVYTDEQRRAMAERKNGYYKVLLGNLSPADILPGSLKLLEALRQRRIKIAVASSSRNAAFILQRIGLDQAFDAVVDGNDITRSKPAPEIFLLAAQRLGVPPATCLVVEDAEAGITAAHAAGMPALGVSHAAGDPRAELRAAGLDQVTAEDLLRKTGG
jgi:beta-phosphoglucomutase